MSSIQITDSDNGPPKTRILPPIPTELSEYLAGLIDLDSAKQLMLTCRSLYSAGEIRLYSDLDVTGSWNGE